MADLAFPVTSDAEEVKRFLSGTGNRVVFSTYQSSSVIAAAQADPAIPLSHRDWTEMRGLLALALFSLSCAALAAPPARIEATYDLIIQACLSG